MIKLQIVVSLLAALLCRAQLALPSQGYNTQQFGVSTTVPGVNKTALPFENLLNIPHLVSTRSLKSHLDLLKSIHDFKDQHDDQWELTLITSISRFNAWTRALESNTDDRKALEELLTAIPVDILMVWHAFVLRPIDFHDSGSILVGLDFPVDALPKSEASAQQKFAWETLTGQPFDFANSTTIPHFAESDTQWLSDAIDHQSEYVQLVSDLGWLDSHPSEDDLFQSVEDYHRFLILRRETTVEMIMATLSIDLVWHTHQLFTSRYHDETFGIIGAYANHIEAPEGYSREEMFADTKSEWSKLFSTPFSIGAGSAMAHSGCTSSYTPTGGHDGPPTDSSFVFVRCQTALASLTPTAQTSNGAVDARFTTCRFALYATFSYNQCYLSGSISQGNGLVGVCTCFNADPDAGVATLTSNCVGFLGASIEVYNHPLAQATAGIARRSRFIKAARALLDSRRNKYCPQGQTACNLAHLGNDYECLDITSELESCGGCLYGEYDAANDPNPTLAYNRSFDCNFEKSNGVSKFGMACRDSQCVATSCLAGYSLVEGACVKNIRAIPYLKQQF